MQAEDNVDHILANCIYAQEVWHRVFGLLTLEVHCPTRSEVFAEWWLRERTRFRGADRRGFDTLIAAVAWALWKQRNARVFNRNDQQKTTHDLPFMVLDEIAEWRLAGVGVGGLQRFVRS